MVPEETQEATDGLNKSQSKSVITQLDDLGMVIPNEYVSSAVPEITQPCVNHGEGASMELPFSLDEALFGEEINRIIHDADTILYQNLPQEFAFPFPDPASTLDIQGSRSDQVTCCLFQKSVSLCFAYILCFLLLINYSEFVHEGGGVQPPNTFLYSGSTINPSMDISVPNNSTSHNPQAQFPFFWDLFDYELEKLRRETENSEKKYEETTSDLLSVREKKKAEVCSEYARQSKKLDAEYKAKVMEEEASRSAVRSSSVLWNAFTFKSTGKPQKSEATDVAAERARSTQHPIWQQQAAVQPNTHVNLTAPPRPSVTTPEAPFTNPSGPLLQFPRFSTTQPTPASQRPASQLNTHLNSTSAPRPSVTALGAPMPNTSGPVLQFPHFTTTQLTRIFPQGAVQSNTLVNSRPSVTSAEAQVPIPSDPVLQFPSYTSTQPTTVSQRAAVQSNTNVNSTAPPLPSNTTAAETQISNPSGPVLQSYTTTQPTTVSQRAAVQSNTPVSSTAPPQPSVIATGAPTPNPSGPIVQLPSFTTTQSRPISQQAAQSNTHVNSTTPPRPLLAGEAISSYSLRCTTSQPRQPPPMIPNVTPSSSPPVHGVVRCPAPHLQRFRQYRAPNPAVTPTTTNPGRLGQEGQQKQGNSEDSGGLVYISDDEE
ncbi:unnamed protein product [Cochlearia groenlandica]